MQTENFGDFTLEQSSAEECLSLSFSPSARPLRERWRNNGLSANFVSDYMTTFLPSGHSEREEIKTAVSYIANELLENAMKFCDHSANKAVTLHLDLEKDRIIFTLMNRISAEQKQNLKAFLNDFCGMDPMDYFVTQMEKNAEEETESSGVGFATMIIDYNAQVGWAITDGTGPEIDLTTRVYLPL